MIGLHGDGIDLDLSGVVDSSHGGIRARFSELPDAPFTRFFLRTRGGKHAILENSEDICWPGEPDTPQIEEQEFPR